MTEPVKDFESFYTGIILPSLHELENKQVSVQNWRKFTLFTGIGAPVCFMLNYLKVFPSGIILAGGMLLMCFTGALFWGRHNEKFVEDFKEKVIRQIINYIAPAAVYKPMTFISKKEYKASGLYRRRFTHFDGDDFWQCVYNGVAFHCSEIDSWREDMTGKENIFKGLFFIADISTFFSGATYIWPKGQAQLSSSLADDEYRLFPIPHVHKVNVNHEAFSRYFSVYTTNTTEASLIMSYQMPDHMMAIKEKLKKDISFSFVKGKCYIAIPFEENLLEPISNLQDRQEIKNYFYTILLVFNIVRKLDLGRLAGAPS